MEKDPAAANDIEDINYALCERTPEAISRTLAAYPADGNVYNLLNSDYANSINTNFSTTASNQFMRPTAVLQGRLFKIGGQIDF